jgi:hypothetical protein
MKAILGSGEKLRFRLMCTLQIEHRLTVFIFNKVGDGQDKDLFERCGVWSSLSQQFGIVTV